MSDRVQQIRAFFATAVFCFLAARLSAFKSSNILWMCLSKKAWTRLTSPKEDPEMPGPMAAVPEYFSRKRAVACRTHDHAIENAAEEALRKHEARYGKQLGRRSLERNSSASSSTSGHFFRRDYVRRCSTRRCTSSAPYISIKIRRLYSVRNALKMKEFIAIASSACRFPSSVSRL